MTITINLKGRLGNQLFQYAALRNISIKKNYDLYINTNIEWHGQYNILQYFNIKNSNPPDQIQYRYNQRVQEYHQHQLKQAILLLEYQTQKS